MPWDAPRERPWYFTLDPYHCLHNGLVAFYGGGQGCPGSLRCADSSLYGNHGTLTDMDPATDWVWNNYLGRWAIDYDGTNDFVTVPFTSALNTITFAGWCKTPNVGSFQRLVFLNSSSSFYAGMQFSSGNKLEAVIQGNSSSYRRSDASIAANTWYSCAVTIIRSSRYFHTYINGSLSDGVYVDNGADAYVPVTLNLARLRSGGVFYYGQVSLADVCVWGRILSPAEIFAFANPADPMLGGLILPPRRRLWRVMAAPPAGNRRRRLLITGVSR